jgi:molecular chaperone GrpE (heat shock protein)
MKPIHKFNNGNGATLCNQCSIIISVGLTDDLYCNKCRKELLQDIMKDDEALGLYFEQMGKEELKQDCECTDECLGYLTKECKRIEEPEQETENLKNFKKLVSDEISPAMKDFIKEKQETLKEVAEKYASKIWDYSDSNEKTLHANCKKAFIKGAKRQSKRMYSEENVFQFFEKYREDFSIHRNIQVLPSQFEQWFEQFKKK